MWIVVHSDLKKQNYKILRNPILKRSQRNNEMIKVKKKY